MQVKIRGKKWNLRFARLRKDLGYCQPPDKPNKEILIRSSLKGEELLDTLIHEILHAGDWDKDEPWVDEVATDMARILWKLGYRRNGESEE